jgi:GNAT superfamily N-acetyltransferase
VSKAPLENVCYKPATLDLKGKYAAATESNAHNFIVLDDNHYSIIAMKSDEPIGLIVAKKRALPDPLSDVVEVFIDVIEVDQQYQRRGVGTELMRHVNEWAVQIEASQVRAWSEEIRTDALLMWRKMGFTFSTLTFKQEETKRHGFYVARTLP